MSNHKYNSFEGWKEEGLCVKKGEKHILRDTDGTPLFNEEQVIDIDYWEDLMDATEADIY